MLLYLLLSIFKILPLPIYVTHVVITSTEGKCSEFKFMLFRKIKKKYFIQVKIVGALGVLGLVPSQANLSIIRARYLLAMSANFILVSQ